MWLVKCKSAANDTRNSMAKDKARHKGTPIKQKMKHSQSAKHCDCFKDSPDKNVERDYILSFLTKPLQSHTEEDDTTKKKKSRSEQEKDGTKNKEEKPNQGKNNSDTKSKNAKNKKNALKKANSITLKRNRIVPLSDGSGKCVILSQWTTIKETPCDKETKKLPKDDNKNINTNKFKMSLLARLSMIKKKVHNYLTKKRREKETKQSVIESLPKPFVEFEKIPLEDDYVEETFQEQDESSVDKLEELNVPKFDTGRLSVCSSVYFTPLGRSPVGDRRNSGRRQSLLPSPQSVDVEEFEDAHSCFVDSDSRPGSMKAVDSIRSLLDNAGPVEHEELRRRLRAGEPLYPHSDSSLWLRSCEKEIIEPIRGTTTGMIPVWLKGTLLRNGPGSLQVGDMTFQHLFDGSALLHRFALNDGEVTYQCRFLRTNTYQRNHEAGRIVVNEFGTKAVPDPCQTIFKRVSAMFDPGESLSDNTMISVYPMGDEFYCYTESPTIWRVDPTTLETLDRVNVSKHVAVVNHTSHPHVTADGSVYNQAMTVQCSGPHYAIVKFPSLKEISKEKKCSMLESAEVVASVKARWVLHPSYMHTFGLTEHYYVIVEQPLTISVPSMVRSQFLGEPVCSCFRFFNNEPTLIHVVERSSGKLYRTYSAEAFFYLHIINQFERDDHLVIDICCYSDPGMLDCMYYDALKNMSKNPDYGRLFRGRPLRFVLPLTPLAADTSTNLVTLAGSNATACWQDGEVFVRPELLSDLGCEVPRFNYSRLGQPYRFFYAISSDVDSENPATLIKVDTESGNSRTWSELNVYPSEPIFVPSPDPQSEDDGVVLSSLVWGQGLEQQVGLLVLDAASWHELGRTVFKTPSPVPKCLHGWFTADF